jgi:murein L,D-transpeptidase YafK
MYTGVVLGMRGLPMKAIRFALSLSIIWGAISGFVIVCTSSEKPADKVMIEKEARKLTLLRGSIVIRNYRIALGNTPEGPKKCQGDGRTPEGHYIISGRNKNSQYHRSLHISYPNEADRIAAKNRKCSPGGDIFIHGLPNGYGWIGKAHTLHDWTLGCIAVTDKEIEEIWNLVPDGTAVEIRP